MMTIQIGCTMKAKSTKLQHLQTRPRSIFKRISKPGLKQWLFTLTGRAPNFQHPLQHSQQCLLQLKLRTLHHPLACVHEACVGGLEPRWKLLEPEQLDHASAPEWGRGGMDPWWPSPC